MDCTDYITVEPERKPGQHLQREDRGAIQRLRRLGYSNRAIARELNCSPSTVLGDAVLNRFTGNLDVWHECNNRNHTRISDHRPSMRLMA